MQIERIANKIIENLPKLLSREGANKELFYLNKDGLIPSMSVFLLHEIERFNMLIKVIQESVDTLIKAIKGQAVMSEEIE
jgi:Dynein heavy chain C-terminal domain